MKLLSSIMLGVVAIGTVFTSGCATSAEDVGESTAEIGVGVPNPSGAYFASVRANGSGRPSISRTASRTRLLPARSTLRPERGDMTTSTHGSISPPRFATRSTTSRSRFARR